MFLKIKCINKYCLKRFSKSPCAVGTMPRFMPNHKHTWQTSSSLRTSFIDYFLKHNHKYIEPCSLNSKSSGSYFVNSGVNQFKEHILGHKGTFSAVQKAVNSQRCVRLGGKKCDLNNIGYDSSHLSYFEMLGNWSFGSYDKSEACKLMWNFLTEELELPASHLYVTYFGGSDKLGLAADDQTRDIWFNLGVKDSKVLQFGEEHNFWEMGPRSLNSLCGPSTEIHWDYLATMADSNDPRCARCFVNSSSPEVAELWNCVFMEYQWTDGGKTLSKLPQLIVDTGMGLERLASVIQGVCSVYDTDGFKNIMTHLSELSNAPPYQGSFPIENEYPVSQRLHSATENAKNTENSLRRDIAYRIIADHLRTICLCVNDGIRPGKMHAELKVRQLLQRAIRQSRYGLGMSGGLSPLVDTVCQSLNEWNDIGPVVQNKLKNIISNEEMTFFAKLDSYEKSFGNFLLQRTSKSTELSNIDIQTLIDGKLGESISMDMIKAMSRDVGLIITESGTDNEQNVPNNNKTHLSASVLESNVLLSRNIPITDNAPIYNYRFNDHLNIYEVEDLKTTVSALFLVTPLNKEWFIDSIKFDDNVNEFGLLTKETNMYPTKGGQECDKGVILSADSEEVLASVCQITELDSGHIIHWCTPTNPSRFVRVSDGIILRVNNCHRTGTTLHHTGHHIVFAVLNKLLGRVNQTSSSVRYGQGKMQFVTDVTIGAEKSITSTEFAEELEKLCCAIIQSGLTVQKKDKVNFSEISQDSSIRYLTSEYLPEEVRMVTIGESSEICCGTHVDNTSHLKDIIITSLKKVNKAISEVSFVVGNEAVKIRRQDEEIRNMCAEISNIPYDKWRPINDVIDQLNMVLGRNVMSKGTRDMLTQSVKSASKYILLAPSISDVLDKRFSSNLNLQEDITVLCVKSLSIKKAITKVIELKLKTPTIMYDNKTVLIFSPERNIEKNLRECLEELLNKSHQKHYDFILESPKVQRVDAQILSQFVSICFREVFLEAESFVDSVKHLIVPL